MSLYRKKSIIGNFKSIIQISLKCIKKQGVLFESLFYVATTYRLLLDEGLSSAYALIVY